MLTTMTCCLSRIKFFCLSMILALPVMAQETIMFAGDVTWYETDFVNLADRHTFVVHINYDPTIGSKTEIVRPGDRELAIYRDTILSQTLEVYDKKGILIYTASSPGSDVNQAFISNDLSGGLNADQTSWFLRDDLGFAIQIMRTGFADFTGEMVDGIDQYPFLPDNPDVVDFANFSHDFLIRGGGHVSMSGFITNTCKRNHGQQINCISHQNNNLKKSGIITGKEKGQLQSEAAQGNE